MPKLSIVIPTKNEEKNIGRLLKSIKKQTFRDYEVIVADNGSTDKTRDIALSFGARITSGGLPSAGRNAGAKVATGELIFFFDADVVLTPTFVAKTIKKFEEQELDCASCLVIPLSERRIDKFLHNAVNLYFRATEKLLPHAPGFCILVKRTIHEQINGFDETVLLAEDHDYVKRASKVGKFRFLKDPRIKVSVRRLEKDGRFNLAVKYLMAEAYIIFVGEIRSDIFNYNFAHYDQSKKEKLQQRIKDRFLTFARRRVVTRADFAKAFTDLADNLGLTRHND